MFCICSTCVLCIGSLLLCLCFIYVALCFTHVLFVLTYVLTYVSLWLMFVFCPASILQKPWLKPFWIKIRYEMFSTIRSRFNGNITNNLAKQICYQKPGSQTWKSRAFPNRSTACGTLLQMLGRWRAGRTCASFASSMLTEWPKARKTRWQKMPQTLPGLHQAWHSVAPGNWRPSLRSSEPSETHQQSTCCPSPGWWPIQLNVIYRLCGAQVLKTFISINGLATQGTYPCGKWGCRRSHPKMAGLVKSGDLANATHLPKVTLFCFPYMANNSCAQLPLIHETQDPTNTL